MKNRKVKMGVVLLLALVTTTGCGDKAIALTEAEESTIVNYAAHVVAKYNTKQQPLQPPKSSWRAYKTKCVSRVVVEIYRCLI